MAPVPEDNQDIPPSANNDDSEHFSNFNSNIPVGGSDFSDSDDSEDNNGAPNGYSLLPQEPEDDNGFNSDDDNTYITDNTGNSFDNVASTSGGDNIAGSVDPDLHTESVLSLEEAIAPTVSASNESHHPAFLAKFTDGKIPSYMQVPEVPQDKDEHLWNQQRQESNKLSLDPVHESKILKAMSEFSLPTENIPEWARQLPDDQWSQQVLSRIGIVSGRGKHSINTRSPAPSHSCETKADYADTSATDDTWVADFADSQIHTGQK
jgi:hypothetical protein